MKCVCLSACRPHTELSHPQPPPPSPFPKIFLLHLGVTRRYTTRVQNTRKGTEHTHRHAKPLETDWIVPNAYYIFPRTRCLRPHTVSGCVFQLSAESSTERSGPSRWLEMASVRISQQGPPPFSSSPFTAGNGLCIYIYRVQSTHMVAPQKVCARWLRALTTSADHCRAGEHVMQSTHDNYHCNCQGNEVNTFSISVSIVIFFSPHTTGKTQANIKIVVKLFFVMLFV